MTLGAILFFEVLVLSDDHGEKHIIQLACLQTGSLIGIALQVSLCAGNMHFRQCETGTFFPTKCTKHVYVTQSKCRLDALYKRPEWFVQMQISPIVNGFLTPRLQKLENLPYRQTSTADESLQF